MRSNRLVASSAGAMALLGLVLLWPSQGGAQTVSPCCAKLCNPTTGTSTECNPLLLGGLGSAMPAQALARGCIDVELAPPGSVCLGGVVLDSAPSALFAGCICIFGPSSAGGTGSGMCFDGMGNTLTPDQCTAAAVANCGGNITTIPNDPACGQCPACDPDDTLCDGKCVDLSSDPANCGACGHVCPAGDACVDGHCTTCVGEEGACSSKSDCCAGLNCLDAGAAANHQKECLHGDRGR
jgi:hypothetical protein